MSEVERYSSKRVSQAGQRYSYTGMYRESNPQPTLELLRELATLQGVEASDADLEAVLGFLRVIVPDLEALERAIPPEAPA